MASNKKTFPDPEAAAVVPGQAEDKPAAKRKTKEDKQAANRTTK